MAVAFDAASGFNSNAGSGSYAHTCTGLNLGLLVGVVCTIADDVSGVTYNGVAMTLVAKIPLVADAAGWVEIYLFYLGAPATGANNVAVTVTGGSTWGSRAASYTGVQQASLTTVDASNTATASAVTVITPTVTPILDNCWAIAWFRDDQANLVAGAGTTMRGVANSVAFGDSNAPIHPAALTSLQATWAGAGKAAAIIISLAPLAIPFTNQPHWPLPIQRPSTVHLMHGMNETLNLPLLFYVAPTFVITPSRTVVVPPEFRRVVVR